MAKKFSARLFEMEKLLEISPDTLAFILGIKYEMFRRYHNGEWDGTYSIRKDRMVEQLKNIDIEIENKILILKKALRKFQINTRADTPNQNGTRSKLKVK